jgi:hypothetical protein
VPVARRLREPDRGDQSRGIGRHGQLAGPLRARLRARGVSRASDRQRGVFS